MSIAVGQSIGAGYRFLVAKFFRVLGLNWLPTVFLALAGTVLLAQLPTPPAALSEVPLWPALDALALVIVTAFFGAAMSVALMREAFGFHDEAVAIHFVFGRREFRLFLAFLRLTTILFFSAVAVATVVSLILWLGLPKLLERLPAGSPSAWHGISLVSYVAAGTITITSAVATFLWIRFGLFLPAIAAVEDKASLARAWKLSRKNFWRAFLIAAAVAIPVDVLARGSEFALYGPELLRITGGSAPPAQTVQALLAWCAGHAASFAWIGAVMLAVLSSLFAGATEIAYRTRVAEGEPAQDLTPRHTEPAAEPLSFAPAMAAPPLDVTLGIHAREVEAHAEAPVHAEEIAHEALPVPHHADASSVESHEAVSDHNSAETPHVAVQAAPHDDAERPASSPDTDNGVQGPYHVTDPAAEHEAQTTSAQNEEALPVGEPAPETSLDDVPPQEPEHAAPEERILEPAA